MKSLKTLTKVILFILLYSSCTVAELPPHVYELYRKTAPEKIMILVETSASTQSSTENSSTTDIRFIAQIVKVFRSESGLSEGQTIKITYQIKQHEPVYAGPSEPLHVETGKTYVAYLTKKGDFYTISAGGQSFVPSEVYQKYYHDE